MVSLFGGIVSLLADMQRWKDSKGISTDWEEIAKGLRHFSMHILWLLSRKKIYHINGFRGAFRRGAFRSTRSNLQSKLHFTKGIVSLSVNWKQRKYGIVIINCTENHLYSYVSNNPCLLVSNLLFQVEIDGHVFGKKNDRIWLVGKKPLVF